jgi:uncharacterized delta-60 repeat protein
MRATNRPSPVPIEPLEYRVLLSAAGADSAAGKVLYNFGETDRVYDVAAQRDGGVVVLGSTDRSADEEGPRFFVARFLRSGRVDRRFGDGGKVISDLPNFRSAYALAVAPDGKILVGGAWLPTGVDGSGLDRDFGLARFNRDGSLDTTFGDGGRIGTDLSPESTVTFPDSPPRTSDEVIDLAVLHDGSVLAAGVAREVNHQFPQHDAVVRYGPDGHVDPSFGQGGHVLSSLGTDDTLATRVEVQSDGKVLLAGGAGEAFGFARLNPDGSPDATFGDGGRISVRPAADRFGFVRGLAVLPDGAILAAGSVTATAAPTPSPGFGVLPNDSDVAVVRLTPAGQPDPGYGDGDGVVVDDFGGEADVSDLAASPDGSALVAGKLEKQVVLGDAPEEMMLLEHYTPTGRHDGSLATQPAGNLPIVVRRSMTAEHVAQRRGGKLVVAGMDGTHLALARFTRRGRLDRSFGGPKAMSRELRPAPVGSGTIAMQPDGTVTVEGTDQRDSVAFDVATSAQGTFLQVKVNGRVKLFPIDSVHAIVASGGEGDDVLTVAAAVSVPAQLNGGFGDDVIVGGAGDDDLRGDDGNDHLTGGAGNDHVGFNAVGPLNSEPGDDILFGGAGEDWMVGGHGTDQIYGGADGDHWSLEDQDSEMLDRTSEEPKDIAAGV